MFQIDLAQRGNGTPSSERTGTEASVISYGRGRRKQSESEGQGHMAVLGLPEEAGVGESLRSSILGEAQRNPAPHEKLGR